MSRLLFVHAISPLHPGTGHAVGAVDLPLARDRATGFPYLPGSSIKGSLRDVSRGRWGGVKDAEDPEKAQAVFGPGRNRASERAGQLLVGDGNLLLLPVRSIAGTFAWVTCPFMLQRFARDAREAGVAPLTIPAVSSVEQALVTTGSSLKLSGRVVFEDMDFAASDDAKVTDLAKTLGELLFPKAQDADWKALLQKKLCVVHDDIMAFLSEHATDVVTRIAIDPDKKTVKDGALWTEESLPTESVLVSLVAAQAIAGRAGEEALRDLVGLLDAPVQFGGDATTGRGRCRLVLTGGAK